MPAAASNLNTYGRVNYVDRQHFVGQAYNRSFLYISVECFYIRFISVHDRARNSYGRFAIPGQLHNYGFDGYIDQHGRHGPFAPNNFSGQSRTYKMIEFH